MNLKTVYPTSLKTKQKGSIILFVAIILPVVLFISFSANTRGKTDLKIQGDFNAHASLAHFADNAIAETLEHGSQIADAIAASKGYGGEDNWQVRTFTIDESITAKTEVQATQLPTSNTSPNQLTVYLVTIKAKVTSGETTIESETKQHLVEMGIP